MTDLSFQSLLYCILYVECQGRPASAPTNLFASSLSSCKVIRPSPSWATVRSPVPRTAAHSPGPLRRISAWPGSHSRNGLSVQWTNQYSLHSGILADSTQTRPDLGTVRKPVIRTRENCFQVTNPVRSVSILLQSATDNQYCRAAPEGVLHPVLLQVRARLPPAAAAQPAPPRLPPPRLQS